MIHNNRATQAYMYSLLTGPLMRNSSALGVDYIYI